MWKTALKNLLSPLLNTLSHISHKKAICTTKLNYFQYTLAHSCILHRLKKVWTLILPANIYFDIHWDWCILEFLHSIFLILCTLKLTKFLVTTSNIVVNNRLKFSHQLGRSTCCKTRLICHHSLSTVLHIAVLWGYMNTEVYLEPYQISMMGRFCENS